MKKKVVLDLPVCLDDVAASWRSYIENNVEIITTSDLSKHEVGTHSVYRMKITFIKPEGNKVMWYAGMTGNPKARVSQHKSELKNCKTTTFTGKSVLYSKEYFENVEQVCIDFEVIHSGLTATEAKAGETILSETLAMLFGKESVLTSPKKKLK